MPRRELSIRFNEKCTASIACAILFLAMLCVLANIGISNHHQFQLVGFTPFSLAYAQAEKTGGSPSSSPSSLAPYRNPVFGVSLQYPIDWQKQEGNRTIASNLSAWSVAFYSPTPPKSAFLKVIELNSTQPNATTSIPNLLTDAISRDLHITKDLQIISATSNNTLAGRPAYMLITNGALVSNIRYQTLEIGTISGNSKYTIVYEALGSVYLKYLPSAQKMISSFRLR